MEEISSFSPKVHPRPPYPPISFIASKTAFAYGRDVVLGVALLFFLVAPYQRLHIYLSQQVGLQEKYFFALMISVTHTGTFFIFNGGILLLEKLGWLTAYKMARKPAEEPDQTLINKLLIEAFVNHFVTSPFIAVYLYSMVQWFHPPAPNDPLPIGLDLVKFILSAHFFNDFCFYWTHRLFHSKLLYKTFHKQHHTFRGSVAAAAEFANPVEVVVSNQIPSIGAPIFMAAHPLVLLVWLFLRLIQTYEAHSGYSFDGSIPARLGLLTGGASFHDHHHTANMGKERRIPNSN